MGKKWNCIVITCPSSSGVAAIKREIEFMQKQNCMPSGVDVLATEDPAENIGSGAATLNALVVATEFLSVQQGYMVVTADVLCDANILILLYGRNYLYNGCGKPFVSLPSKWFGEDAQNSKVGDYITSLEVLFQLVNELQCDSSPGVWVCSTDMLLLRQNKVLRVWSRKASDAVMFCVPSDVQYATNHGIVSIDEKGYVEDIIYCGSKETIENYKRSDGTVPLVSGIVYLSISVAESLLSLHALSPLDSCTYMGLDSGAEPIQVSLFFDILLAMSTKMTKEDFISGRCGKVYNVKVGFSKEHLKMMNRARSLVWEELAKYKMASEILEGYRHIYWSDQLPAINHIQNLNSIASSGKHNIPKINGNLDTPGNIFINSIVECHKSCTVSPGAVICNSILESNEYHVGRNCYISGITTCSISDSSLKIPDDIVVLRFNVLNRGNSSVVAVFGIHDDPQASVHQKGSTFANRPWSHLFDLFGIKESNLWSSSTERKNKNLMNAKLYPCGSSIEDILWLVQDCSVDIHCVKRWKSNKKLSISEIIQSVDHWQEFDLQRQIYAEIISRKIKKVLVNNEDQGLLKYFHASSAENWHDILINTLDSVLGSENSTVVLTRTLSCMADLLGTMAGKIGGLRSGPGANKSWAAAFEHLMNGNLSSGMKALKEERMKWIDRPDRLMRAARHYERAAQILIHNSVKTAQEFMKFNLCPVPEMNEWVIVECPARIDLQGGWTDTPPICYELGGSVVNIAVLVDGKKPIGAKAQRIREPSILLKVGLGELSSDLVIEDIKDLLDYDQPNACVLGSENNTVVLTRTLSCMADLLGTMAGKIGGLRSGPGANKSWAAAFEHLMNGNLSSGMKALKEERMKWIDRPDRLMRAARHYERAAQILIHNSVKTAQEFMKFNLCPVPEMNEWVIVECPARIDLQGGWTDTPPICYELGGSVVNIAVLVDGKKPIGAKAQRIREPSILLKVGLGELSSDLVIEDIKDLLDYDQPNACGSLLKAAIICTDIVDVHSELPLWEQLLKKLNGGIEVHSWSHLPQGCGMGGSSILAGAVIAVLLRVSGKAINKSSILHAVLGVEQLLTTGGGWQDQVGGLMGGINRGYSDASLPLHVRVQAIPVSPSFTEVLNRHLLLIDTGKVRLAKNLLQNVIRNWYARDKTIVTCFRELLSGSLEFEEALKNEDLEQMGILMKKYWKLKKILAPGCEPSSVNNIMKNLDHVCYGQLLVGAGGGGFMCILTKQPDAAETVKDIISNIKSNQKISIHKPTICFKGLDMSNC